MSLANHVLSTYCRDSMGNTIVVVSIAQADRRRSNVVLQEIATAVGNAGGRMLQICESDFDKLLMSIIDTKDA
jgi:hypothetical protein